jgi:hypothetical protein
METFDEYKKVMAIEVDRKQENRGGGGGGGGGGHEVN